jgi:hypothetical protein
MDRESAGVVLVEKRGKLLKSKAIKSFTENLAATEQSVDVADTMYQSLKGSFVPFHTHLGYPASFHGLARFAPTAEDIWAHRSLMKKFAKTNGTDLTIPGMILHASGEVTLFWAGNSDSQPVRIEVISSNGVERGEVFVRDLAWAVESGTLVVKTSQTENGLQQHLDIHRSDLWFDRKRYLASLVGTYR